MLIEDFYKKEAKHWRHLNQKLFGLTSVSYTASTKDINNQLKKDEEKYWKTGTCYLKEELLLSKKIVQKNLLFEDSFNLTYNEFSNTVCLSANFLQEAHVDGKKLSKTELEELMQTINDLKKGTTPESDRFSNAIPQIKEAPIVYMPLVTKLGYRIKKADYTLRTQAIPNTGIIKKNGEKIVYKAKEYSIDEFVNKCIKLDNISKMYLESLISTKLTKENMKEALLALPEYDIHDFRNFTFKRFNAIRALVLNSPKTANIEKNRTINIAGRLKSQSKYTNSNIASLSSNLILTNTEIEALEVSRQVVYPSDKARGFSFTGLTPAGGGGGASSTLTTPFDSFKTKDNINAGRVRQLLDIFYVDDDDIIKTKLDNKTYNQFELYKIKDQDTISCLSKAPFNFFNAPKRLMMANKMRAQAVPIKEEVSKLTHEIPARVIFGDFEGFSVGDSFVISESFAKKLETTITQKFELVEATHRFSENDTIETRELIEITGQTRYSAWKDITVVEVGWDYFIVSARIPFGVGDKITNLHGSKGIASLILPDSEMPHLIHDLSVQMKKGPVDVIVPGLSVMDRKTFAQIFEAVARGLDLELSVDELIGHIKEIEAFDKESVFKLAQTGKTFKAPCGIQHFLRLNHDASTKQVITTVSNETESRLGYMELNNLAARGYVGLLGELMVRCPNKNHQVSYDLKKLQETGELIEDKEIEVERINSYLAMLGFRQTNEIKTKFINPQFKELLKYKF